MRFLCEVYGLCGYRIHCGNTNRCICYIIMQLFGDDVLLDVKLYKYIVVCLYSHLHVRYFKTVE